MFKNINESFERKFQDINNASLITNLTECLHRLNESEMSDEDKHDSELIRSMIDKMQVRSNAAFTPEEKAVMDKYGISRDNNTKTLEVDGRNLNRDVDDHHRTSWYKGGSYNNGNKDKINYADRARKLPQRKDNQIFKGHWTADNDQINGHKFNKTTLTGLQDAERHSQDLPMMIKMRDMKDALSYRKLYQSRIDNADKEKQYRLDTAQKAYDSAVADAERNYKWDTEDAAKSRNYYQNKIDTLLKRDKKEENLNESPMYDMSPNYDSRQSFYGKARVDDNGSEKTLYSYNTPVAKISNGQVELLPKWDWSQTTLRHVKEFLKQNGFEATSLSQIRRDYL